MGDWRKGRTTRNIWQAIGDAYVLVFSLVVVLAMVISLIVQAQGQASGCTSTGCQTARGLLPWAALSGVLAFALAAAGCLGRYLPRQLRDSGSWTLRLTEPSFSPNGYELRCSFR